MLQSLRAKVIATMGLLIALVLVIAAIGVNSIHSLDRSVDRELNLLLAGTQLSNGLVSNATSEIRSDEQYLVRPAGLLKAEFIAAGDSAYAFQRRYRDLGELTTADRVVLNRIAS